MLLSTPDSRSTKIAVMGGEILIIDDEERMGQVMEMALQRDGHHCHVFTDPRDALAFLERHAGDVVLTDLKMPQLDGLEVLERTRRFPQAPPVILITAHGTVATAVAAMRDGAFDYVTKPFDNDELRAVVARALEMRRLRQENDHLRREVGRHYSASALVAESRQMRELLEILQRVAPRKATVLVQGESGTGKELVARLLHHWSDRAAGPFVAINCKAFAEGVLESELFGHVRGAYTGAGADRTGCFERATGGTLFLDEIGEITPDFQAKLLRVLQEGEVLRVGADAPVAVDTRVVAATNRDLRQEMRDGRFREDLYFRLNVIPLDLAPLRERPEDVVPLAEHFLAMYCREEKRDLRFSPESVEALRNHRWPGNVRELQNAVERAVVLARASEIAPEDFLLETTPLTPRARHDATLSLREHLDRAAAERIRAALEAAGGSRGDAAAALGIERTTLYRMMKKLGL
jgi:DNA-binding NtrC family response regulator